MEKEAYENENTRLAIVRDGLYANNKKLEEDIKAATQKKEEATKKQNELAKERAEWTKASATANKLTNEFSEPINENPFQFDYDKKKNGDCKVSIKISAQFKEKVDYEGTNFSEVILPTSDPGLKITAENLSFKIGVLKNSTLPIVVFLDCIKECKVDDKQVKSVMEVIV